MSQEIKFAIEGIDRIDAMELRELLTEQGLGDLKIREEPNQSLAVGQLGSPDLLNFLVEVDPYIISALTGVVALWITRKTHHKTVDNVHFEISGSGVVYNRFSGNELARSSDPAQIAAALKARLQPSSKK